MLTFGAMVDDYRVMHFTPQPGFQDRGTAFAFKPVIDPLEDRVWTVVTVMRHSAGRWFTGMVQTTSTNDERALADYCRMTGYVPDQS